MTNSYTLPKPKMWLMITILIITAFGTPFAVIIAQMNLLGTSGMTEFNTRYGGPIIIFLVIPIIVAIIVLALTRRLYYKKAVVGIDSSKISIREKDGNLLYEGPITSIHTFFFMDKENGLNLKIWDVNERLIATFTSNMLVGSKCNRDMRDLFHDLLKLTQATEGKTIPNNSAWSKPGTYFHSTISKATQVPAETFQKNIKKKNIKGAIIGISIFVVVVVALFYFVLDSKHFYELDDDGNLTYGRKVMVGVNPDEFRMFGYDTGKDCTYVYFKGVRQDKLDVKTFESIGGYIFSDKNGLYREPRWSGDELEPLEGIDKASFRCIGHRLYADRNHVYALDLMLSNPLVPMKGDDVPDPATFEEIDGTYSFFRDGQYVYHSGMYGKLKRCPDIDRNTFEVVTYRVFKDKNHVYFLTYNLRQDGGNQNEESSEYDILRDADALTFVRISDTEFEDKNTTWTIESKDRSTPPSSNRRPRTR